MDLAPAVGRENTSMFLGVRADDRKLHAVRWFCASGILNGLGEVAS
jgi:hypothetical protein